MAISISVEELQLAARNHGMPLEALRYDVTPVGLHYLLTHYDIPFADSASWHLSVGGAVSSPLSLSIADVRALPAVTRTVTMECAGNGRALTEPRASSQPWLLEAVGNSAWTGARVVDVLARAAVCRAGPGRSDRSRVVGVRRDRARRVRRRRRFDMG